MIVVFSSLERIKFFVIFLAYFKPCNVVLTSHIYKRPSKSSFLYGMLISAFVWGLFMCEMITLWPWFSWNPRPRLSLNSIFSPNRPQPCDSPTPASWVLELQACSTVPSWTTCSCWILCDLAHAMWALVHWAIFPAWKGEDIQIMYISVAVYPSGEMFSASVVEDSIGPVTWQEILKLSPRFLVFTAE